MDINDIRGLGNVAALVAFLGVIYWAYGSRRKARFEEDGNLPFADEDSSSKPNTVTKKVTNAVTNSDGGGSIQ